MAEEVSWTARTALQNKQYDAAEVNAKKAYQLSQELLKKQSVDSSQHLAIALGAAIEVRALVMAERGERDQAVVYLRTELKRYYSTSIRTRIQKNINLLSLEGKPAPALDVAQWLGPKPLPLAATRGKPVLLFFWAHWCGDCKAEVAVLARVQALYGNRLAIIAPTQLYGYVGNGDEAPAAAELKYTNEVRARFYAPLSRVPVPVSGNNFKKYGASTTPTLVLIDRAGIVRLYHPGSMTFDEMKPYLGRLLTHS
jgi:thiol-disulfide isomerase/thioredoxin